MSRKDLDNIFAKAKKANPSMSVKKSDKQAPGPETSKSIKKETSLRPKSKGDNKASKKSGSSADPFGLTPSRKNDSLDFTEEGWKVYTSEELNLGKGGDTADCPFDCNCCF